MSTETPEIGQWISLSCPRCKARFRIKSAYGHMSGRCPNCGKAIEPPLPALAASPGSFDLNEPSGLVPIEEEWPEPAQLEGEDGRPLYEFGSLPTQWPEPKPPKPPELEGYGLEGGPLKPLSAPQSLHVPAPVKEGEERIESLPEAYSVTLQSAPSESGRPSPGTLPEAYPVDLPHAGPSSARSTREIPTDAYQATLPELAPLPFPVATPVVEDGKGPEKIPPPPSLPPSRPLWEGVYTFPWHLGSLRFWIFAGLEMGFLGFLLSLWCYWMFVVKVLDGGVRVEAILVVGFIPIIAILGLLSGSYWAANFAAIVEESAGGNDTFSGPDLIGEWFGYLLHLLYIGFCSFIPSLIIGAVVAGLFDPRLGMLAGLVAGCVFFPVFYLSSLAGNSRLAISDRRVVGGFLRNPRSTLVLFLVSCFLATICIGLGYLIFVRNHFLLALLVGLCWSTCVLIYARLLGRVAWVISQGGVKIKKRKKRRKKPTPGPEDWGTGTESPVAEKPVGLS